MNQEEELLTLFKNVNDFIPIFQALADSERLLILLKLFYAGPNGKNVTELSGRTRLSRPAVSHHLKVLKAARIINSRKDGTQVYYSLDTKQKISNIENLANALLKHLKLIDANQSEPIDDAALERIVSKARDMMKSA
ncbi:MAG: winged helix-turn-helix transcriptional regulator [Treponema sp.]|nr:winged helix-turn-helix transcriptional regulator [Treponema sp.]MBR5966509.1 winged helix-turn-helix transcriptional regulator [Treponema sp.]